MERLLVYDLGGGTFDVSVAQVENGVVEILASHGDTQLGGDDFDQLLLDHICDAFAKEHGVDLRAVAGRQGPRAPRRRGRQEAALVRRRDHRSRKSSSPRRTGNPLNLVMEIARYEYEELIQPLLLEDADLPGPGPHRRQGAGQPDRQGRPGGRGDPHSAGPSPARGAARAAGPQRDRARPGRRHGGGRPGGPDRRASTSGRSWSTSRRTPSASRRWASSTGSSRPTPSRRSSSGTRRCPPAGPRSTRRSTTTRTRPRSGSSRARTRTRGTIPWSASS